MTMFVLNKHQKPLMPCSKKRGRLLLNRRKARVHSIFPYRPKRFSNRKKTKGWLALSLGHRLETTLTWIERFRKRIPISAITCERVRFNTQKLLNPEIEGVEYSRGTLFGYEVREYLLDAACTGNVLDLQNWQMPTQQIISTGRGSYQKTRLDKFGFPRGFLLRQKRVNRFQTGDLVIASVPTSKKEGHHVGRVAIRASGYFNIQTRGSVVQEINSKYCSLVQRSDGYHYPQRSHGCKSLGIDTLITTQGSGNSSQP